MNKTPQSRVRILIHIEQTTSGNKSVALNMRYTKINVYVFPCEKTEKQTIFRFQADRLRRSPVYVRTSTGVRLDEVFFDSSRSCKCNGERDHLFTSLDFSRSPSLFS